MKSYSIFIKERYSKRHHFLPVFYLKGFTDQDELIFVYDKKTDNILPKQKPESKFYEKHLNNYKFDGKVKFTLEESIFTPMDGKASQLFAKIRSSEFENEGQFSTLEKFEMLGFISRLFWRSPDSNKLFVEIIKKEGLSNKYFGFKKKGETEFVADSEIEIIKSQILNDEKIQKIFKYVIPFSYGNNEEVYRLHDKWKIYSLKVQTPNIITGDSPFLINNEDARLDNIFNELIFPIGKHKLLTLSDKSPTFLDAILLTNVNLSILHQSKRFIASDSEEHLKQLLVYYNQTIKLNLDKTLVKDTFEIMYSQSTFKNHDEYYQAIQSGKVKFSQST